jgi:hypothetical protein
MQSSMPPGKPPVWLNDLSSEDLLVLVEENPLFSQFDLSTHSIEEMGNLALPRAIDGSSILYASWPEYWSRLKAEFRLLICTADPKYKKLRQQLSVAQKKSQTAIVSTIAAAMASEFGVVAGVLVPFCALCLIAAIRLGKEAFCTTARLETHVR